MAEPGPVVPPLTEETGLVAATEPLDAAAEGRARMQRSAISGSLWTMLSVVVGLPLNLVANVVVARLLGPDQYGLLATLTAALTIGLVVLNAGVSDATVQWGAGFDTTGDQQSLVELVRRTAGFHILVQAPISVVLVAVLVRDESRGTVLVACIGMALVMIFGTSAVVQVAINRTARSAQVLMISNIALQGAVVATAVVDGQGPAVWAVRIFVGGLPGIAIMALLPRELRWAVLRPLAPKALPRGFVGFALKAGTAGVLSTLIYSRSEIFVLQHYDLAMAAGVFALAFGLSYQLTAPVDSLLLPLIPAAAGLIAIDHTAAARGLLRALRLTNVGTALILGILTAPIAALIPLVYGGSFTQSAALFVPLAAMSCLQSVNGPVIAFVTGARKIGSLALVTGAAFAIDITLAFALIPRLGAWGAVIANAVGQAIAIGLSWWVISSALAVPLRNLVATCAPVARAAVVSAVVSSTALAALTHVSGVVVALTALGAGFVLLALANRVGPPALEAAEVDLVVSVAPRRTRSAVRRAIGVLHFAVPVTAR